MNREMKIYVLQNKRTKKIVAQFDYNYYPAKLKYTDSGLPPYIWSEEEFDLHTEEDIAKEKWIDLSKFEFKLVDLAFQNKWQKLKKWLNDRMEHYNDCLNENVLISLERQGVLSARYNQCFETIAQMEYIEKELEGEDE